MHEDNNTYSREFNPISKIVHTDSLNNRTRVHKSTHWYSVTVSIQQAAEFPTCRKAEGWSQKALNFYYTTPS